MTGLACCSLGSQVSRRLCGCSFLVVYYCGRVMKYWELMEWAGGGEERGLVIVASGLVGGSWYHGISSVYRQKFDVVFLDR